MNFISLRFSYKKGEIIRPVEAKCHTRLADPEGGRMSTITPYDHLRGRGIFLKIILQTCDPFWVIYKYAAF